MIPFPPSSRGRQLPPVCPNNAIEWCFEHPLWPTLDTVELTEIVRQGAGSEFASVLSRIRLGLTLPSDVNFINNRSCNTDRVPHMALLPFRKQVDRVNAEELARVPGDEVVYAPEYVLEEILSTKPYFASQPIQAGPGQQVRWPKEPPTLRIKPEVPLRASKNIYAGGGGADGTQSLTTANGERGVSMRLTPAFLEIKWDALGHTPSHVTRVWRAKRVRRQTWRSPQGNPVVATVSYMPISVAYASTIHSSQGLSLSCPVDADVRSVTGGPGNWVPTPAAAYIWCARPIPDP